MGVSLCLYRCLILSGRGHLGDVSKLLFSCQGLLSNLLLCSVAGPVWGCRERIFYPDSAGNLGRQLGRGQGTPCTTKQLSAVFPITSSRNVVKVKALTFMTLSFLMSCGRMISSHAKLFMGAFESPALGASRAP